MSVWGLEAAYSIPKGIFHRLSGKAGEQFESTLSSSVTRTQEKLTGEVIGITALAPDAGTNVSYVVAARYAECSTREQPVIQVNIGGSGYQVCVNEVNPKGASMLEMFALCCYTDQEGITEKGTCTTFGQLKLAADHAAANGYGGNISNVNEFIGEKQDWESIVSAIKDDYLEENKYDQYLQCLRLMDLFDYQFLKNL